MDGHRDVHHDAEDFAAAPPQRDVYNIQQSHRVLKPSDDFAKQYQYEHMSEEERLAKREEAAAEMAKLLAEADEKNMQEQLKTHQPLDPDEIRRQQAIKQRIYNETEVYPKPATPTNNVEEAIFRKNLAESHGRLPKRAKLIDVFDEKLNQTIITAFALQIGAAILYFLAGIILAAGILPRWSYYVFIGVTFVMVLLSAISLYTRARQAKRQKVPYDQLGTFSIATIFPGFIIRIIISYLANMTFGILPAVGTAIGPIIGILLGSSLYYSTLKRLHVPVDLKLYLINIVIFASFTIIANIHFDSDLSDLVGIAPIIAEFCAIDFFVMNSIKRSMN